jgi:Predicted integral membrane protein (DUF2269)
MALRKTLKILHTLSSCGLIGAIAGYAIVLLYVPQETPAAYAQARQTIAALCNYLLVPSMAISLSSGLLSIAAHRPFHDLRWVWVKAALGISMFEAILGLSQSKANEAAALSAKMAQGEDHAATLATTLAYEWHALAVVFAISVANIVLGIWRPILKRRQAARQAMG